MRPNPIRDTQFPSKEGVHKNKQTNKVVLTQFTGAKSRIKPPQNYNHDEQVEYEIKLHETFKLEEK